MLNHTRVNKTYNVCEERQLPAGGDGSDLREGELEQDLLLVIHHVHPRPVDRDDDVILGQARPGKLVRLGGGGKQ